MQISLFFNDLIDFISALISAKSDLMICKDFVILSISSIAPQKEKCFIF